MSEAPPPDAMAPDARGQQFRCPNCGAPGMHYDPTHHQLVCDHCAHQMEVPKQEGSQSIVEHDLEHGLAKGAARGLGTEVRTTRCQECGATVSFPTTVTATACDFCGSSQVLEQQANRNLIRPESVVPFAVDNKQASERFRGWLSGLWFRPSDLKGRAKVTEIQGVYVPYWTFDAHVDSDWTADAGYYYYETESYTTTDSEGDEVERERQVRKVRWEPAWGARADDYDDVLVCASRGLPEKLAARLSTFDTNELKPYAPAYLAGWKAEEYAVELNDAWQRALHEMEDGQRSRCAGDVPGDTHRFLNVTNRFSKQTYKHVLLPIWISAYRYGEDVYRFLVNGQTGEVVGKAPWSVVKITLFILSLAALIAAIVVLVKVLH